MRLLDGQGKVHPDEFATADQFGNQAIGRQKIAHFKLVQAGVRGERGPQGFFVDLRLKHFYIGQCHLMLRLRLVQPFLAHGAAGTQLARPLQFQPRQFRPRPRPF